MILEGLLMFLGNEVNRPNSDGDTPMHLAARGQHAACLDRLLNTNHLHSNIQVHVVVSAIVAVIGRPSLPQLIHSEDGLSKFPKLLRKIDKICISSFSVPYYLLLPKFPT